MWYSERILLVSVLTFTLITYINDVSQLLRPRVQVPAVVLPSGTAAGSHQVTSYHLSVVHHTPAKYSHVCIRHICTCTPHHHFSVVTRRVLAVCLV